MEMYTEINSAMASGSLIMLYECAINPCLHYIFTVIKTDLKNNSLRKLDGLNSLKVIRDFSESNYIHHK
jgi:hypothetical protein